MNEWTRKSNHLRAGRSPKLEPSIIPPENKAEKQLGHSSHLPCLFTLSPGNLPSPACLLNSDLHSLSKFQTLRGLDALLFQMRRWVQCPGSHFQAAGQQDYIRPLDSNMLLCQNRQGYATGMNTPRQLQHLAPYKLSSAS